MKVFHKTVVFFKGWLPLLPAVECEAVAIRCSGYSQEVSVNNLIHFWWIKNILLISAISTPERAFRNHILKLMPNFKSDCLEMRDIEKVERSQFHIPRKDSCIGRERSFRRQYFRAQSSSSRMPLFSFSLLISFCKIIFSPKLDKIDKQGICWS